MADPYADRAAAPVAERPLGEGPTVKLIEKHGGLAAGALASIEPRQLDEAGFVGVAVRDQTLLPPIARIDASFAVMLLVRPPDGARGARAALDALLESGAEILLLKEGPVAGPAGREGALAVDSELLSRLLAAARGQRIEWERDPDFGYEVAAAAPGIDGAAADALCPRLLYAAADRVYEHAELVAETKRERYRRVSEIADLDEQIVAATGWPIEPTGQSWKEE